MSAIRFLMLRSPPDVAVQEGYRSVNGEAGEFCNKGKKLPIAKAANREDPFVP